LRFSGFSGGGLSFFFVESIRASFSESLSVVSLAIFVESFLTESAFALSAFALSAFVIVSLTGTTIEPGTALTKSSIVMRSRARRIATTGSTEAIWVMLSASPSRVAVLLPSASAGIASCREKDEEGEMSEWLAHQDRVEQRRQSNSVTYQSPFLLRVSQARPA
jgi:hypothetical protein